MGMKKQRIMANVPESKVNELASEAEASFEELEVDRTAKVFLRGEKIFVKLFSGTVIEVSLKRDDAKEAEFGFEYLKGFTERLQKLCDVAIADAVAHLKAFINEKFASPKKTE